MIGKLKNWLRGLTASSEEPEAHPRPPRASGERRRGADRREPDIVDLNPSVAGKIESNGPGKNVLVRNKYQREDTGTHETLKIIDGSAVDSSEETGIDPYNTGNFDRSRNWDKRFRK